MTDKEKEVALAAFLDMTSKITNDDIQRMFGEAPARTDLVVLPNESPDASEFLNENRKPLPDSQKISDALKASHAWIRKNLRTAIPEPADA